MRLQDIMSTDIKSVSPSVTVATARNLMRVDGIHHLLVVDDRRVVGVVSIGIWGGRVGARRADGEPPRSRTSCPRTWSPRRPTPPSVRRRT